MRERPLRALRGAAAATVAVLLAAVSHTLGGGAAPSPAILVGVSALAWPLATALVGRRLRPTGLAASVILAQAILHVVFALTNGVNGVHAGALHEHGSLVLDSAGVMAHTAAPTPPMLIAHLVAAIASFVLLFAGERMIRALAAWTHAVLGRALAIIQRPLVGARVSSGFSSAPRVRVTRGSVRRRGPPLLWGDVTVA